MSDINVNLDPIVDAIKTDPKFAGKVVSVVISGEALEAPITTTVSVPGQ